MHFISVEHAKDAATGQFYGCRLQLQPLLGDNIITSATLYIELWHRLRRDNTLRSALNGRAKIFDASLYLKDLIGTKQHPINAAILYNNAVALQYKDIEKTTARWLKRMDDLLINLLANPHYRATLEALSSELDPDDRSHVASDIKTILKMYCRDNGLLVDESDVERIKAERKAVRRQAFQADVKAGRVQIPPRGANR